MGGVAKMSQSGVRRTSEGGTGLGWLGVGWVGQGQGGVGFVVL